MWPLFFAGSFALAGAIAAAGPTIIHLLNRRRYRVVSWAAMDFLLEAAKRNRRILQLRDLVLLALRTVCVLLFGLAMARPYLSSASGTANPDQPLHAVLVIDNSLSMGYAKLDGTLLDEARAKAAEFVQRLPQGSRISVLPLCGSSDEFSWDPYRTKDDAQRALERIELVDRSGTAAQAIDLARQACQQAPDLPSKRVVYISDQQAINWPAESLAEPLKALPEIQVVQLGRPEHDNAWIADFKLQDGIADVETTAVFLATLRYEGAGPRSSVQVTLTIDGVSAATKTVDLEPGQTTEVAFPHKFDLAPEPGQASFVPAEVSIPPDALPGDNMRALVAPVVAALPVVFVDQFGGEEDPRKNQYGETFLLRRLLAPVTTRGDFGRQLIRIVHKKIEELDRDVLDDARLVVIAGVASPEPAVQPLREYVSQGGPLVIAAGGAFDPAAWNSAAWLEGAGILPAPIRAEPIGQLPTEANAGALRPLQLDFDSMVHDYFLIEGEDRQSLADLYGVPVFFKAIEADVSEETLQQLLQAQLQRITEERVLLAELQNEIDSDEPTAELNGDSPSEPATQVQSQQRLAELRPQWLLWSDAPQQPDAQTTPEESALRGQPRVLARFTNKLPFLVERSIGRGQVLLITSGVFAQSSSVSAGWNNLATTDAVLLFDRIFRTLLERTLPRRNRETAEQIVLPVSPLERRNRFALTRPAGSLEPLAVDALGGEAYGVAIRNTTERGHYKVTSHREAAQPQMPDVKTGETILAINGPQLESELRGIEEAALRDRLGTANYRWVAAGSEISLEGAAVRGQNLWRWLMAAVFVCLLAELAVLAWPAMKGRAA